MTAGEDMAPVRAMGIYPRVNRIVLQKIKAFHLGGNIRWHRGDPSALNKVFGTPSCDAIWPHCSQWEFLPAIYLKDSG
jgi:hypothetical protein